MSREADHPWTMVRLGKVAKMFAGGTPSRAKPEYFGGNIPWLKSGEVRAGRIVAVEESISELGLRESSARVAKAGTPVIAMYGATAGVAGILAIDAAINQAILAVTPNAEVLDARFCYRLLQFHSPRLLALTQGSGQPNLSKTLIEGLEVELPSLPEQRRIAEILSSVDEAIQAIQAVIEQTRKVRLLLLNSLFHRGQWEEQRALPDSWKLVRLDDVAKRGSGHTPSKSHPEYWNGGVKWVSLQDTKRLDDVYISETTAEISELGIANSSAVLHPAGTVVLSRDATVGRSAILSSPMAVSQHFIAWTCSPKLSNVFLYYWLQHMKPVFDRIGAGSTIKTIGLPFFKNLEVPLPPLDVQEELGSRMIEIDQAVRSNRAELECMAALKASLISDLLTGRRRVFSHVAIAAE